MRRIQVVLREDIPRLGDAGELVSVKNGYARNYLLPEGKAYLATASRLREIEHHQRIVAEKAQREITACEAEKRRIEAETLEFAARVGEGDKLFGSITTAQIAERLAERDCTVDRRKIALAEPIKSTGEFEIPVRLHGRVEAQIRVRVVAAE